MRVDESALEELAGAVADGTPIDWLAAEAGATTPAIREEVRKLARLARISDYHTHSPDVRARDDLHDSIRHEAGDGAGSDAPVVRWGPLTIIDKVGQGSFGDVYRARDGRVGRDVALKLLRHKYSEAVDASHVIDEARLMAQVRHPNVTAVFGADRIDGRVGLWMEFIDGPTLEAELVTRGPFGEEDVRIALVQIAQALRAVHQSGLVHGDVKAQNVMRAPDGRLLLTDFGTGRPVESTDFADPTSPAVAGSPLYLAPELFTGSPPSVSADLYSLGVLAYHLATGSFPVQGKTLQELSQGHSNGNRTRLKDAASGLSSKLTSVIDKLIDPDPAKRYRDAEAILDDLSAATHRFRYRLALFGSAAVVVGAMIITAWLWRQSSGSSAAPSTTIASAPEAPAASINDASVATAASGGATSRPATDDLPRVTSASSRARELYREAADVMNGPRPWNNTAAEKILKAALNEDPSFASAHILIAWTIANRAPIWNFSPWSPPNRDPDLVRMLDHANKAVRLAANASTVEQYFINGSAHEIKAMTAATPEIRVEEYQRARRAYEGLRRLAPNHRWVQHNLANTYVGLNLFMEYGEMAVAVSDDRPDQFGPAWMAAQFFLGRDDTRRASIYAARAANAPDRDRNKAWTEALLRMFEAHAAWVRSDVAGALAHTDRVVADLPSIDEAQQRGNVALMASRMYVALGRLDAASGMASALDPGSQKREQALVLSERGDRQALTDFLRASYQLVGSRRGPVVQLLFVPSGLLDEARSSLSDTEMTWMFAVRGQLALAEGHPNEAVAHFERAIDLDTRRGLGTRYSDTLDAVNGLASAWQRQTKLSQAISILEQRLGPKGEAALNVSSGYSWMRARAHLAELYRLTGRERDARSIEAQLLKLLSLADETHPLRLALKARG